MMVHFIGLFLPLVISNILHMVVVKKNLLAFLKIPINKVMFGQNKTWRGMIFVPLLNAVIHYSLNGQEPKLLLYGGIYGLAYTLSELPNSWVKRRLNIRSGERSEKLGGLQFVMDKTDSALGVALAYSLLESDFTLFLSTFLLASGIHMSLSFFVYKIGLKESL